MRRRRLAKVNWSAAMILCAIVVSGCAPYYRAKSPYSHRKTRLQVALPDGWLRYRPSNPDLTITRDGLRLESITISISRVGEELEGTERVYHAGMLPHEVVDLSLGLLDASDTTKNFEIENIEIATVAGRDGYKADASYVDEAGLPKRLRMYGAMISDYLCEFRFAAAEPIYFLKYEGEFEGLVASARVAAR